MSNSTTPHPNPSLTHFARLIPNWEKNHLDAPDIREVNRFKKGWMSKYPTRDPNHFPLMLTSGYYLRDTHNPDARKYIKSLYYELFETFYDYTYKGSEYSSKTISGESDYLPPLTNNPLVKNVINGVNSHYQFIERSSYFLPPNNPLFQNLSSTLVTSKKQGRVTNICYGDPKTAKLDFKPENNIDVTTVVRRPGNYIKRGGSGNNWNYTSAIPLRQSDRWRFEYKILQGEHAQDHTINNGKWEHAPGFNNGYGNHDWTTCVLGYFPRDNSDTQPKQVIVDIDFMGTTADAPWYINLGGDGGLDLVRQFIIDTNNGDWVFNVGFGHMQFNKESGFDLFIPLIINRGRNNRITVNFHGKFHWYLTGPDVILDDSDPYQDDPRSNNWKRTTNTACVVLSKYPKETKVIVLNPENWITPKYVPRIIHGNGERWREWSKPMQGIPNDYTDLRRMQGIHFAPAGEDNDAIEDTIAYQHYYPGGKVYIYHVDAFGRANYRDGPVTSSDKAGDLDRKGYLYSAYVNMPPGEFVTIYNHITGYHETRIVGTDGRVAFVDRGPIRLSAYPAGKGLDFSGNIWYGPCSESNARSGVFIGFSGWRMKENLPNGVLTELDSSGKFRDGSVDTRNYPDTVNNTEGRHLDIRPFTEVSRYIRTIASTFVSGKYDYLKRGREGCWLADAKTWYNGDITAIPEAPRKVVQAIMKLQREVADTFKNISDSHRVGLEFVQMTDGNKDRPDTFYPAIGENVTQPDLNKRFIFNTTGPRSYTVGRLKTKYGLGTYFHSQRPQNVAENLSGNKMSNQRIQFNIDHPIFWNADSWGYDEYTAMFFIVGDNNIIEINVNAPIYLGHSSQWFAFVRFLYLKGEGNKVVINVKREIFIQNRSNSGRHSAAFASVSEGSNMVAVFEYEQGNIFTFYPAHGGYSYLTRIEQDFARGIWGMRNRLQQYNTYREEYVPYADEHLANQIDQYLSDYQPGLYEIESISHVREIKSQRDEAKYKDKWVHDTGSGDGGNWGWRRYYEGTWRHTTYKFHYNVQTNANSVTLDVELMNIDGQSAWSKEMTVTSDTNGLITINDLDYNAIKIRVREKYIGAQWSEWTSYDSGEVAYDSVRIR